MKRRMRHEAWGTARGGTLRAVALTGMLLAGWLGGCDSQEPAAVGTVTGTLTLAEAPEHAGVEVVLTPASPADDHTEGVSWSAFSTAEGHFSFERVPVGQYTLTASKPGYAPAVESLEVRRGETASVSATLARQPTVSLEPLPSLAFRGGRLTLKGGNFGATRGTTVVRVGGVEVREYLAWTDTEVEIQVPWEAGPGPLDFEVLVEDVPWRQARASTWVTAATPLAVSHFTVGITPEGGVAFWGRNTVGQGNVPQGLTDVVSVSAGDWHGLALRRDGTVVGWGGTNVYGIGYGQARIPEGLRDVVAVSAGAEHSLALTRDGTVVAWGRNESGEATVPAGLRDVVAVTAGSAFSMALKRDGTVAAWGAESETKLIPEGLGDVVSLVTRRQQHLAVRRDGTVVAWGRDALGEVRVPAGIRDVVAAAVGSAHTVALKRDGTVVAWGFDTHGETNVPAGLKDVMAVAADDDNSYALKRDGTVVLFGATQGVLPVWKGLTDVVDVAASPRHAVALKRDGTVVAWSFDGSGGATVPAGLREVVAVAAGHTHSLALKQDGTVAAWSLEGVDLTVPAGLQDVVAVAAGDAHSVALQRDGTVVAWGDNSAGQATVPDALHGVVAVAAGIRHSLAVRQDGTVVSWGSGATTLPEGLKDVVAVAPGVNHTLALQRDGTVLSWGGTTHVPANLGDVVAVAASGRTGPSVALGYSLHSLALRRDGTVMAWGLDTTGQTRAPVGLSGVVRIAATPDHSLAVKSDGTVVVWGEPRLLEGTRLWVP